MKKSEPGSEIVKRPRRGDVFWVDFTPARGVEQQGRRPAVIIQNDTGNRAAPSTIVAAITRAPLRKPYPFAVHLPAGEGGLETAGYVNCAQIMTIDVGRLEKRTGSLSVDRMQAVDAALRYQLTL